MRFAVCIKCGHRKAGPLQFCRHCGFIPVDPPDQARSILLSTRHRTLSQLDAAAADIQRGRILLFDPAELQARLNRLERQRAARFLGIRQSTWLIVSAASLAGVMAAIVTILVHMN